MFFSESFLVMIKNRKSLQQVILHIKATQKPAHALRSVLRDLFSVIYLKGFPMQGIKSCFLLSIPQSQSWLQHEFDLFLCRV